MPKITKPAGKPATEKVTEAKASPAKGGATKESLAALAEVAAVPRGSVYYEMSVTKNMGDFNSAKISVGITLSFDPTADDIEEAKRTIGVANAIVEEEIEKQVAELGPVKGKK